MIDQAVDREYLDGNLLDALTLSARGHAVLAGHAIVEDPGQYGVNRRWQVERTDKL